jgi:carboxylesterase
MREPELLAGAEEFTLGDGPVGVLLIHGFTGSPQGLRGLGEYLADRGLAVVGVRLPGHGTTWQDLNTKTSGDWAAAAGEALDHAAAGHAQVFIVALSFGAALALDLAARRPEQVSGLVTLAGFISTRDPRRWLAPVIKRISPSIAGVSNDIADPDASELAYDRFPTRAGHSMLRFIRQVRGRLNHVVCPTLIMHGRHDHTVHPSNAQLIYDSISSPVKEIVWCERSHHVITLDYDRSLVYERTYQFIKEHSGNGN